MKKSSIRRGDKLTPEDLGGFVNLPATKYRDGGNLYAFIGDDEEDAIRFAKSLARPGHPIYVCKVVAVATGRIETEVHTEYSHEK